MEEQKSEELPVASVDEGGASSGVEAVNEQLRVLAEKRQEEVFSVPAPPPEIMEQLRAIAELSEEQAAVIPEGTKVNFISPSTPKVVKDPFKNLRLNFVKDDVKPSEGIIEQNPCERRLTEKRLIKALEKREKRKAKIYAQIRRSQACAEKTKTCAATCAVSGEPESLPVEILPVQPE